MEACWPIFLPLAADAGEVKYHGVGQRGGDSGKTKTQTDTQKGEAR